MDTFFYFLQAEKKMMTPGQVWLSPVTPSCWLFFPHFLPHAFDLFMFALLKLNLLTSSSVSWWSYDNPLCVYLFIAEKALPIHDLTSGSSKKCWTIIPFDFPKTGQLPDEFRWPECDFGTWKQKETPLKLLRGQVKDCWLSLVGKLWTLNAGDRHRLMFSLSICHIYFLNFPYPFTTSLLLSSELHSRF